jgi:hypothetical protein
MTTKDSQGEPENHNPNINGLPLGATRESNLLKTPPPPKVDTLNQMIIDPSKTASGNNDVTVTQIAQAFGIAKDEIIEKEIDGKGVFLIPYGGRNQLEEVMKMNSAQGP